ncbi:hypothetical protein BGZ95_009241 [Linnemannia exigua]|uniref:Mid2 domain-containing protein n=1 Tax=Linnemannia exigua TaxID=604196 RepID=A0AAD4H815_9FUNG|nr:hypothetical protein BGZ95_009241 [Linnemannia exigua]
MSSLIKITQLGLTTTANTIAFPNGTISPVDAIASNKSFVSSKLYAWSGQKPDYDVFTTFSYFAPTGYSKWLAIRQIFRETDSGSYLKFDLGHFPPDDPLLALGTYTNSTDVTSAGHTIVFDKFNQAMSYATSSTSFSNIKSTLPLMTLSSSTPVSMNNNILSSDAIPVTMSATGYILDRAKTVFQQTWSGPNLISKKGGQIGAIVSGVIGGLVVISIAIIFFIRRRRQNRQDASTETPKPEVGSTPENIDNSGLGYAQFASGYLLPPSFVPPPPSSPFNNCKDFKPAHHVYRPIDSQVTEVSQMTSHNPEARYNDPRKLTSSLWLQGPRCVPNRTSTTESAGCHPQQIISALSDVPASP